MGDLDPRRGIYCNRTLNLHAIQAIGYDMDYTLVHYHVEAWERLAYAHLRDGLAARGWPVGGLEFDARRVARGLILDLELGNVVKADRFGYVKRACHGAEFLDFPALREHYARTRIDLREPRWSFLNTLFSTSEGCMFAQLVDAVDDGDLPGVGYSELYRTIHSTLDEAHMEGELKAAIMRNLEQFVDLDRDMPLALLDQKQAGKKLLLITNSEWSYTEPMLRYAIDPFLPDGLTWRQLFDLRIVAARKPSFFEAASPAFEVVGEDGSLREARALEPGRTYVGGNAKMVERALGLTGEEILYVGDHLFVDVNVSKSIHRWRTALILRELEQEIEAGESFARQQRSLDGLMADKERLEAELARLRLALQHVERGRAAGDAGALGAAIKRVRADMAALDEEIAPLARAYGALLNDRWGLLMRAGNDKSHLARQVERYADIYTSRVSNFRAYTPFAYLRSPRQSLPHG